MKKILSKIYVLSLPFLANPVFAQAPPKLSGDGGDGPSIATIVDVILGFLFPAAGLIALIFIVIGGYMWIVSAGDPSRVKQAQGTLTWAVIGLILVMIILGVLRVLIKFLS